MHLYDRACRKFRQNKLIWKEYLHYLVRTSSMQKFNRVVSSAVQVHPDCLDFWLIAAYAELDIKGNLFSSRNLMLQALKVNDQTPKFYTEYLKFEVKFLDKLMERRKVLNGKPVESSEKQKTKAKEELAFIDDGDDVVNEENETPEGEIKAGEESNLVKIVVTNLLEKFSTNVLVLKEAYKILKESQYVDEGSVAGIKTRFT
jgi:U3 small nucleolar RNA-associated protein 6